MYHLKSITVFSMVVETSIIDLLFSKYFSKEGVTDNIVILWICVKLLWIYKTSESVNHCVLGSLWINCLQNTRRKQTLVPEFLQMECSGFLSFTNKNLISCFKHFSISMKNIIDFSILNQAAFTLTTTQVFLS